MLTIRRSQFQAIERIQLIPWLSGYLKACYPRHIEAMGDPKLEDFIKTALAIADERGLSSPADLRKYVHVTFLLGAGFESDPAFMWARKILDDQEQPELGERVSTLEDIIIERLESKRALR